jgi:hypothetical protein
MPCYAPDKSSLDRIRDLARQHGLWALPEIVLSTEQSISQIGAWRFLAAGQVATDGLKAVEIFIHQLPDTELEFQGKSLLISYSLNGKKRLAQIVAHEIRHCIDCQKWWWGLASWLYPKPFTPELEVEARSSNWLAIKLSWLVYALNPIEISARLYTMLTWRKYYMAIHGVSYFADWMSPLHQGIENFLWNTDMVARVAPGPADSD